MLLRCLVATVEFARQAVARKLERLHNNDKHSHRAEHDIGPEPLITIANGQISQPAAAHRGVADQRKAHYSDGRDQSRKTLRQVNLPNDPPGCRAQRHRGFNDSTILGAERRHRLLQDFAMRHRADAMSQCRRRVPVTHTPRHSYLSASMGSTCNARRAGNKAASPAAMAKATTAPA